MKKFYIINDKDKREFVEITGEELKILIDKLYTNKAYTEVPAVLYTLESSLEKAKKELGKERDLRKKLERLL